MNFQCNNNHLYPSSVSVAGGVDEPDGDLSRWEYLTSNYDRDDFFTESTCPSSPTIAEYPVEEHYSTNQCANGNNPGEPTALQSSLKSFSCYHESSTHFTTTDLSGLTTCLDPPTLMATSFLFDSPFESLTPSAGSCHHDDYVAANLLLTGSLTTVDSWFDDLVDPMPIQPHVNFEGSMDGNNFQSCGFHCLLQPVQPVVPMPRIVSADECAATTAVAFVGDAATTVFHGNIHCGNESRYSTTNEAFSWLPSSSVDIAQLQKDTVHKKATTVRKPTKRKTKPKEAASVIPEPLPSAPMVSPFDMGKMCLPLTAYNYFFRSERENILRGLTQQLPGAPLPPTDMDFSQSKQDELLYQRWFVDPYKGKRDHCMTHGRIDFRSLSKEIAKRWRHLPAPGRAFYRNVAKADQEEYDRFAPPEERQKKPAVPPMEDKNEVKATTNEVGRCEM